MSTIAVALATSGPAIAASYVVTSSRQIKPGAIAVSNIRKRAVASLREQPAMPMRGVSFGGTPTIDFLLGSATDVHCPVVGEAEASYLCVWETSQLNVSSFRYVNSGDAGAKGKLDPRSAFFIILNPSDPSIGHFESRGTWAVTVP